MGFEVFRLETEDELEGTPLEREGRNSNRLQKVCLVRLLDEAGPQDDELPAFQAEARPGGGPRVVVQQRDPRADDPPTDAAYASRRRAEVAEVPAEPLGKRCDDDGVVNARQPYQQKHIPDWSPKSNMLQRDSILAGNGKHQFEEELRKPRCAVFPGRDCFV